ncbi:MAG: NifU family protein [Lachnospiraceae bacterium]
MTEIVLKEIEEVLDRNVRPNLAMHGGNIRVVSLEEEKLYLRMVGQCSGCPSANLTMENLVNTELTEAFPKLKQVSLVTGVSDALLLEARELLKKRRN